MTSSGVISAEHFCQGHVAVFGDVIFDVVRVDLAAVAQHHAHFLGLGRAQLFIGDDAFLRAEFLDHAAFEEVLFHQEGDIVGGQAGVMHAFWVDHHLGTMLHRVADARGFQHLDFVDQALGDQLILQRVDDLMRASFKHSGSTDTNTCERKKAIFHLPGVVSYACVRTGSTIRLPDYASIA